MLPEFVGTTPTKDSDPTNRLKKETQGNLRLNEAAWVTDTVDCGLIPLSLAFLIGLLTRGMCYHFLYGKPQVSLVLRGE